MSKIDTDLCNLYVIVNSSDVYLIIIEVVLFHVLFDAGTRVEAFPYSFFLFFCKCFHLSGLVSFLILLVKVDNKMLLKTRPGCSKPD